MKPGRMLVPYLTPEQVEAAIVGEDYYVFPGTTMTVCCLKLRNGFSVIGEAACLSAINFDEQIGRKLARETAFSRVWELEGYLERERFFRPAAADSGDQPEER